VYAYRDLLFAVRRSVRYHRRRQRFLEGVNRVIRIVLLLSGFGTITVVTAKLGESWTLACAFVIAVVTAIDLVTGVGKSASLHGVLAGSFLALEREMIQAGDESSDKSVREFMARRLEIEADEPAILRVLDCMCHNDLLRAMGYDDQEYADIPWWQRLLAHVSNFGEHRIRKRKEKVSSGKDTLQ